MQVKISSVFRHLMRNRKMITNKKVKTSITFQQFVSLAQANGLERYRALNARRFARDNVTFFRFYALFPFFIMYFRSKELWCLTKSDRLIDYELLKTMSLYL